MLFLRLPTRGHATEMTGKPLHLLTVHQTLSLHLYSPLSNSSCWLVLLSNFLVAFFAARRRDCTASSSTDQLFRHSLHQLINECILCFRKSKLISPCTFVHMASCPCVSTILFVHSGTAPQLVPWLLVRSGLLFICLLDSHIALRSLLGGLPGEWFAPLFPLHAGFSSVVDLALT